MEPIRWPFLITHVSDGHADRVALFDEAFPAEVEAAGAAAWFTTELALVVLQGFAGSWPTLGRRPDDPADQRSLFVVVDGVGAVRFAGRNLAHPDDRAARVVVLSLVVARRSD